MDQNLIHKFLKKNKIDHLIDDCFSIDQFRNGNLIGIFIYQFVN